MKKRFWVFHLALICYFRADIDWKFANEIANSWIEMGYDDGMTPDECADEEFSCWSD